MTTLLSAGMQSVDVSVYGMVLLNAIASSEPLTREYSRSRLFAKIKDSCDTRMRVKTLVLTGEERERERV